MKTWLWPDRKISKTESRALREEHNALVNVSADLLAQLVALTVQLSAAGLIVPPGVSAAIAKAKACK